MKGIMFKEDLFLAIAQGKKTMTRRIVRDIEPFNYDFVGWNDEGRALFENHYGEIVSKVPAYPINKTYYVKEPYLEEDGKIIYQYDHKHERETWMPKMFMPGRVARYFIKIVDIDVQELCMISLNDIYREGFKDKDDPGKAFKIRWEQINGPGSFGSNPYVFVYEFELLTKKSVKL